MTVHNLGLFFDNNLTMKKHINLICKTAFLKMCWISVLRHYLSAEATKTLVSSLVVVLSRLDYCNSLLASLSKKSMSQMSKLQSPDQCCSPISPGTFFCTHHTNSPSAPPVANQILHLLQSCMSASMPSTPLLLYFWSSPVVLSLLISSLKLRHSWKFQLSSVKTKATVLFLM